MTIKEIKQIIINRILDDKKILSYIDKDNRYCDRISDLKYNIIFDYFTLYYGYDFISVEVSEWESKTISVKGQKDFTVMINLGLSNIYEKGENKLDALSENIERVINELFPNMTKYTNIPLHNDTRVIRQISFDIM